MQAKWPRTMLLCIVLVCVSWSLVFQSKCFSYCEKYLDICKIVSYNLMTPVEIIRHETRWRRRTSTRAGCVCVCVAMHLNMPSRLELCAKPEIGALFIYARWGWVHSVWMSCVCAYLSAGCEFKTEYITHKLLVHIHVHVSRFPPHTHRLIIYGRFEFNACKISHANIRCMYKSR